MFCSFSSLSKGSIYVNDSTCRFIFDKIFFSGWPVSSDKADSLGVRLEFMKEGQHHRNKTADWSELSRIHYPRRILTPTSHFERGSPPRTPIFFLNSGIHRVYKFSGTFRPAEHDSAKKLGGHRDSILGIAI